MEEMNWIKMLLDVGVFHGGYAGFVVVVVDLLSFMCR